MARVIATKDLQVWDVKSVCVPMNVPTMVNVWKQQPM